jgi:protocatechuate 3,4-dioxygenase, alpha subunit
MTDDSRLIPAGSQTVGPFFSIGLDYLIDRAPVLDADKAGRIEVRGRVLDRDGTPVPDAVLEFWSPRLTVSTADQDQYPSGFRRTATDINGNFAVAAMRPAAAPLELIPPFAKNAKDGAPDPLWQGRKYDGRMQAPHMLVLVFARGLLRHLLTRVYFENEPGNTADTVLKEIPAERRATLIARLENHQTNSYQWDVRLQGQDETVFFAW